MPNRLSDLTVREVSLVDHPANSSKDEISGEKIPRARVALWKRDESEEAIDKTELDEFEKAVHGRTQGGTSYPRSDYAYTPDDTPSHWKLRLTSKPGGAPDPGIVGAAAAALGAGFRGKKVVIPSSDRAAVVARVRAAWRKANPDKPDEEMPAGIRKVDNSQMTLAELETQVTKQDGLLATLQKNNDELKKSNDFLLAERDAVIKMSKSERKAYASMSPDLQKAYMAEPDVNKRKAMCDTAMKRKKEKAAEDCMDDAVKAEYAKAGPAEKLIILGKQIEKMEAEKADREGGSNEDGMDKNKKKAAKPPADGSDNEPDDDEDDDVPELKRKLAKQEDIITKMGSTVTLITKQAQLVEFTKMAETEFPNTPGNPVEKGDTLMKMAEALGGKDTEMFKSYMATMKAYDQSLAMQYREVGKAAGGEIPAEKMLFAKAEDIAKRDSIPVSKAMEKVLFEQPQLYYDYQAERGRIAPTAR